MAINTAAVRTAIREVIEASGSFAYGYFAGQPPQATAAKTAQSSTAQHWFDVVLTPARVSPFSSVVPGNTRRLMAVDVRIPIVSRLPPPSMETSRSAVLADIETECAAAARALSQPGALAFTAANDGTRIVGGMMTDPRGFGEPSFKLIRRDSANRTVAFEIRGSIVVRSAYDVAPAAPSLDALGSDLLYHWEVPAADSPLITLSSGAAEQLNDRAQFSAHLTQATAAYRLTYSASGGPNDAPYVYATNGPAPAFSTWLGAYNLASISGQRLGLYAVTVCPDNGWSVNLFGASEFVFAVYASGGNLKVATCPAPGLPGGYEEVTVAAADTSWHAVGAEYRATGCVALYDWAEIAFANSGPAEATVSGIYPGVELGYALGDKSAFLCVVRDPDDAKRAIVETYVSDLWALL